MVGARVKGRPPKDVATAVRALVWLQLVHNSANGASNLDLDRQFANAGQYHKPRAFSQIAKHGIDPGSTKKRRYNLVKKLGKEQQFKLARDSYYSLFWRVIGAKEPSKARLRRYLTTLAALRMPALSVRDGDSKKKLSEIKRNVRQLANSNNIDDLALLIVLYLLLLKCHALERAIIVRDHIIPAALRYAKSARCDDITTAMFVAVIRDRILLGHWDDLVTSDQISHAKQVLRQRLKTAGRGPEKIPRLAIKAFCLLAISRYRVVKTPQVRSALGYIPINKSKNMSLSLLGPRNPKTQFDLDPTDPLFLELLKRFI